MISNNYFLVTTAIKETWKSSDPILFLGEWCKKESTASDLDTLNYKIVKYTILENCYRTLVVIFNANSL